MINGEIDLSETVSISVFLCADFKVMCQLRVRELIMIVKLTKTEDVRGIKRRGMGGQLGMRRNGTAYLLLRLITAAILQMQHVCRQQLQVRPPKAFRELPPIKQCCDSFPLQPMYTRDVSHHVTLGRAMGEIRRGKDDKSEKEDW